MKALILTCSAVVALTACGKSEQPTAALPASPVSNATAQASADVRAQPQQAIDVWVDLDPETFRKRYDELAKANGSDTIKRMVKTKSGIGVVMNDTLFQRGIAELKELDLANGRFENELAISLSIDSAGKIIKISVLGDRSDPVNLMFFVNAVGIVNAMLNPGQDDKTSKDFLVSLNLMRGDKDESIGQTISSFNRGGAFTCLSVPSNVGTLVGCAITPRS
ncbi:hypothetical protein GR157_00750 [Burkholderia sp. 4701]|nr:hypothetical protein [Burkholderia sp. 4701]MXN83173.1 hypothetical protein [Burkholderia sp. 4812]